MSEEKKNKSIIYSSLNYGLITLKSVFWNDLEDFKEKDFWKMKIIKFKIYAGDYQGKFAIFGISITRRNVLTGEIIEKTHKVNRDFQDTKEFEIKPGEYLTDFHIRLASENEYISQLGYSTKKSKFLFPEKSDDGEERPVDHNGGQYVIVGTFGCLNEKLDAIGCLLIPYKDLITQRTYFPFFILRYIIKKNPKFKEEWDKKCKDLAIEYQYIWKFINLPKSIFSFILQYCIE